MNRSAETAGHLDVPRGVRSSSILAYAIMQIYLVYNISRTAESREEICCLGPRHSTHCHPNSFGYMVAWSLHRSQEPAWSDRPYTGFDGNGCHRCARLSRTSWHREGPEGKQNLRGFPDASTPCSVI